MDENKTFTQICYMLFWCDSAQQQMTLKMACGTFNGQIH
jgi:hypothetical protein